MFSRMPAVQRDLSARTVYPLLKEAKKAILQDAILGRKSFRVLTAKGALSCQFEQRTVSFSSELLFEGQFSAHSSVATVT